MNIESNDLIYSEKNPYIYLGYHMFLCYNSNGFYCRIETNGKHVDNTSYQDTDGAAIVRAMEMIDKILTLPK